MNSLERLSRRIGATTVTIWTIRALEKINHFPCRRLRGVIDIVCTAIHRLPRCPSRGQIPCRTGSSHNLVLLAFKLFWNSFIYPMFGIASVIIPQAVRTKRYADSSCHAAFHRGDNYAHERYVPELSNGWGRSPTRYVLWYGGSCLHRRHWLVLKLRGVQVYPNSSHADHYTPWSHGDGYSIPMTG